ncbi:antibiotic biosynthesis monooxygenase family protein [Reinekea thalattae]|uniref:Antibiotic biosynthesis monooxygenase n=1 Tax=Reinekea thalattae TaxID=2593301 RepID=A0A5C8Z9J5_9GAMM|nr:antibiotic biosynthesis monooxygenase [Reinekea thalattae]TXR54765.1 antibiotic biosynthesis monooxygenase [Reinekea thalattae]
MIAVIFQVTLNDSANNDYFEIAKQLKEHLVKIEGFISVERFQSINEDNRYLSLSFWKDEDSVKQWRNHHLHLDAQETGIQQLFSDYRICVAHIDRDYTMNPAINEKGE